MSVSDKQPLLPLPTFRKGVDLDRLMTRAQRSQVGRRTKVWFELEQEHIRLSQRLSDLRGDRVIASVIESRVEDVRKQLGRIADEIAALPAIDAVDVVCKLCIVSRQTYHQQESQAGASGFAGADVVNSALDDLLSFLTVKSAEKKAPPSPDQTS